MGEVYRARDTKLNRDVAFKVLPDAFASDPDRLPRFTREAQTLASLNHPNIAHIHGIEESGGVRALVMELVEGDDLSQRIARGAIPVDEALDLVRSSGQDPGHVGQRGVGCESFAVAGRTAGRRGDAQRESGESRHLDNRDRAQPPEPRDVRCATRRMAGVVARWHTSRVRPRLVRFGGTAGEVSIRAFSTCT